jgi:hypothetical protein
MLTSHAVTTHYGQVVLRQVSNGGWLSVCLGLIFFLARAGLPGTLS